MSNSLYASACFTLKSDEKNMAFRSSTVRTIEKNWNKPETKLKQKQFQLNKTPSREMF